MDGNTVLSDLGQTADLHRPNDPPGGNDDRSSAGRLAPPEHIPTDRDSGGLESDSLSVGNGLFHRDDQVCSGRERGPRHDSDRLTRAQGPRTDLACQDLGSDLEADGELRDIVGPLGDGILGQDQPQRFSEGNALPREGRDRPLDRLPSFENGQHLGVPGGELQEVLEESDPLHREETLRMKLHAVDGMAAMANPHHLAVNAGILGPSTDFQVGVDVIGADHQTVVAGRGEGIRESGEDPQIVMVDL
jgi:hypothetical protein